MAKQSIPVSSSLATLLRERRQQLGLSLRDVQERTEAIGTAIPFTTLGKVERGMVDPGAKRLNLLCKLYGIPIQLAADAIDLEEFAGELPSDPRSSDLLLREVAKHWQSGDLRKAMAQVVALRNRDLQQDVDRSAAQESLLSFSILAGSMGKYHLAQSVIDDLLLEPPQPELLVRVLVQAAVCWHRRGSGEAALGFLARAEARCRESDHQQIAYIRHERANTLVSMGEYGLLESELEIALSRYRKAGDDYGEGVALGVRIRAAFSQRKFKEALRGARGALEHAKRHDLARLQCIRRLDEGKALVELGSLRQGMSALDEALALAITRQDNAAQFYAYHARWRAQLLAGDNERAELELSAARYAVRYIDGNGPEAQQVRATLRRRHLPAKRRSEVPPTS